MAWLQTFSDGGPVMYLLAVLAPLSILMAVACCGAVLATRIRIPAIVWWVLPVSALSLGALAGLGSLRGVATAAAFASADMRGVMVLNELVPSHLLLTFASYVAAVGFGAVSWAGAASNLRGREPVAYRILDAALPLAVVVLTSAGCGGLWLVLGLPGGLAALVLVLAPLLVGVPLAIASTVGGTNPEDRYRFAATRVLVGISGVLALECLVLGLRYAMSFEGLDATLHGDSETRSAMVAEAVAARSGVTFVGFGAALGLTVATVVAAATVIRDLLQPRTIGFGVLAGVLPLFAAALVGGASWVASSTLKNAVPSVSALDSAATGLGALPVHTTAASQWGDCLLVRDASGWSVRPLWVTSTCPATFSAGDSGSWQRGLRAMLAVRPDEDMSPWLADLAFEDYPPALLTHPGKPIEVQLGQIPYGARLFEVDPESAAPRSMLLAKRRGSWTLMKRGGVPGLLGSDLSELTDELAGVMKGKAFRVDASDGLTGTELQQIIEAVETVSDGNGVVKVFTEAVEWEGAKQPAVPVSKRRKPRNKSASKPRGPAVTWEAPTLNGDISFKKVKREIRDASIQFDECYESGLRREAGLSGDMTVRFAVATDGSVATVEVLKSSLGDRTVGTCIADTIDVLRFPKPRGKGLAVLTYVFTFDPEP